MYVCERECVCMYVCLPFKGERESLKLFLYSSSEVVIVWNDLIEREREKVCE